MNDANTVSGSATKNSSIALTSAVVLRRMFPVSLNTAMWIM
ncbi:hypothetical protein [Xylanibacter caecicola]|nr:hypothetical protein [Xylanibacter caecicola]